MLAIKLRRVGKKKQASFRVVVAEKRSKLQGKFVEDLGWLNPHTDSFNLNKERVNYWLKVGAQPTDSVYNLLVRAGILKGPKIPVHAKLKEKEKAA
jgi:small subunit ribosomal protein S16